MAVIESQNRILRGAPYSVEGGDMFTSGLEYDASNNISGYSGSAFRDWNSEIQSAYDAATAYTDSAYGSATAFTQSAYDAATAYTDSAVSSYFTGYTSPSGTVFVDNENRYLEQSRSAVVTSEDHDWRARWNFSIDTSPTSGVGFTPNTQDILFNFGEPVTGTIMLSDSFDYTDGITKDLNGDTSAIMTVPAEWVGITNNFYYSGSIPDNQLTIYTKDGDPIVTSAVKEMVLKDELSGFIPYSASGDLPYVKESDISGASSIWNNTYSAINSASGDWNSVYETVYFNSAGWSSNDYTSPSGTVLVDNVNHYLEQSNSAIRTGYSGDYGWRYIGSGIAPGDGYAHTADDPHDNGYYPDIETKYDKILFVTDERSAYSNGWHVYAVSSESAFDEMGYHNYDITVIPGGSAGTTASASGTIDPAASSFFVGFYGATSYNNPLTPFSAYAWLPTGIYSSVEELAWKSDVTGKDWSAEIQSSLDSAKDYTDSKISAVENASSFWDSVYNTVNTSSGTWTAGKNYSGIAPVIVDNTASTIAVSTLGFSAQAPLYLEQVYNGQNISGVIIGDSGNIAYAPVKSNGGNIYLTDISAEAILTFCPNQYTYGTVHGISDATTLQPGEWMVFVNDSTAYGCIYSGSYFLTAI